MSRVTRIVFTAMATSCLAGCSPERSPVEVSAADLYAAYLKNAPAADKQYRGHTLVVTGVSGGIDSDGSGYLLTLVPGVRAHLGSETFGADLFQQVTVRCQSIKFVETVLDLGECKISSVTAQEAGKQETPSSAPAREPPLSSSNLNGSSSDEALEAAFDAATGHRSAFITEEEGGRVTTRPLKILFLPFGQVLLTERKIQDGCHACTGAMGIFYLVRTGDRLGVTGRWPKALEGSGFGSPPSNWRITYEFTQYPAIYAETGYMAQGEEGELATITELTPRGPVTSDPISLHYSDAGTIADNERPACVLDGAITNVRKNRSFDVRVSGSVAGTDSYRKRGGKFALVSNAPNGVVCN